MYTVHQIIKFPFLVQQEMKIGLAQMQMKCLKINLLEVKLLHINAVKMKYVWFHFNKL